MDSNIRKRIDVSQGDIAKEKVDAIVNAANNSLLGGGGVDGAIHRAAGPGLLEECRGLGGCPTGEARLTGGHKLPAKHIIHTVGPVWRGGKGDECRLLAACYQNCLKLAAEHGIKQLAFPAISTGVYHFPLEKATNIAIGEVCHFLKGHPTIELVRFICFDQKTWSVYAQRIRAF